MLTPEERIMIGLKALERFKPNLQVRRARRSRVRSEPASLDSTSPDAFAGADDGTSFSPPSLQAIQERTGPLEPYSVILGACEDGLPLLLDLTNPAPGSLLIAGDVGSGKTRLLKAILSSVAILNPPKQVTFSLITANPEDYVGLAQLSNCQDLFMPDNQMAVDLLQNLADAAEQRRYGTLRGPAMILAIDDLASFVHFLDEEAFARLYWLVKHGPRTRIWTLATLSSEDAGEVDERLVTAFRTPLIGNILDPSLSAYLSGDPNCGAQALAAGTQFCLPFGQEWVRFWICETE